MQQHRVRPAGAESPQSWPGPTMKSFCSTGSATAARTRRTQVASPAKKSGSVTTEIAAAPAACVGARQLRPASNGARSTPPRGSGACTRRSPAPPAPPSAARSRRAPCRATRAPPPPRRAERRSPGGGPRARARSRHRSTICAEHAGLRHDRPAPAPAGHARSSSCAPRALDQARRAPRARPSSSRPARPATTQRGAGVERDRVRWPPSAPRPPGSRAGAPRSPRRRRRASVGARRRAAMPSAPGRPPARPRSAPSRTSTTRVGAGDRQLVQAVHAVHDPARARRRARPAPRRPAAWPARRTPRPPGACTPAGLASGPSRLNTVRTPSTRRTGITARIAGCRRGANRKAKPPRVEQRAERLRLEVQRHAQRLEHVGASRSASETERLPCLATAAPHAAATSAAPVEILRVCGAVAAGAAGVDQRRAGRDRPAPPARAARAPRPPLGRGLALGAQARPGTPAAAGSDHSRPSAPMKHSSCLAVQVPAATALEHARDELAHARPGAAAGPGPARLRGEEVGQQVLAVRREVRLGVELHAPSGAACGARGP